MALTRLGTNAITTVSNSAITLDAAEIPNLDTAKITSGQFADARISQSSVVAHSPETDLTPVRHDILTLALKQATQENSTKFNLPNSAIVKFEADADFNLAGSTNIQRNTSEFIRSFGGTVYGNDANTNLLIQSVGQSNGGTDMSDQSGNHTVTNNGTSHDTQAGPFSTNNPSTSIRFEGGSGGSSHTDHISVPASATWQLTDGKSWTIDWWMYYMGPTYYNRIFEQINGASTWVVHFQSSDVNNFGLSSTPSWGGNALQTQSAIAENTWIHWAIVHDDSADTMKLYKNGAVEDSGTGSGGINWGAGNASTDKLYIGWYDGTGYTPNCYMHDIRWSTNARTADSNDPLYISSGTSFTPPTKPYSGGAVTATGTALGTTNVPTSAVTDVSGVMLLKNNAGTNTLGTDVKVYFTADNSNFTEATSYADAGTFSTGIKMIKLGKTTCTSGSDVRWKVEFANQAASSKEAQIFGMGVNY